ncbi:MAG: hypothetical protein KDJ52_27540 [Anaerolineae bacterium]|nr:hypothetical protein [Anaerolineae bacterium]
MKIISRKSVGWLLIALMAAAWLALLAPGVAPNQVVQADGPDTHPGLQLPQAKKGGPPVLPPNAKAFGKSYGEWSVEFWQWLYSMPVDAHPLFDTADCSQNQSGKVWFLGGTFTVSSPEPDVVVGTADRDCTIPTGKALFFPMINVECNVFAGDGQNEQELRDCATGLIDFVDEAHVTVVIDGKSVSNIADYRIESPAFEWGPLPPNNVLGADEGTTSLAVGDGYYVMLPPLSAGEHTIDFTGRVVIPDVIDFSLDIHYDLTVQPGSKK